MLHNVLMILQYFCSAGIIGLVLVQRGKGAEAGAGFGAGASGTVFGARGAGTALSRTTAVLAGLFMITSLALAYVGTHKSAEPASVLDRVAPPAASTPQPVQGAASPAAPTPSPTPP